MRPSWILALLQPKRPSSILALLWLSWPFWFLALPSQRRPSCKVVEEAILSVASCESLAAILDGDNLVVKPAILGGGNSAEVTSASIADGSAALAAILEGEEMEVAAISPVVDGQDGVKVAILDVVKPASPVVLEERSVRPKRVSKPVPGGDGSGGRPEFRARRGNARMAGSAAAAASVTHESVTVPPQPLRMWGRSGWPPCAAGRPSKQVLCGCSGWGRFQ